MLSRDCLGRSGDEECKYDESERRKSKSAPRKRQSNARTSSEAASSKGKGSTSKKRRAGKALTTEDIPAIVKVVMDSLPGTVTQRNSDDEDEAPTVSRGKYLVTVTGVC